MRCPAFFPIPHSPMHGALRPHFSSRKSRKTTRPRLNTFLLPPHSPIASRFLHACRATFITSVFTIGAVTCFKKPSPLAVCNFPGALESHRWLELSPTFADMKEQGTTCDPSSLRQRTLRARVGRSCQKSGKKASLEKRGA